MLQPIEKAIIVYLVIIFRVILNSVIVMKLRSGKILDVDSTLTESVECRHTCCSRPHHIACPFDSPDIVPTQLTAYSPIPPTPSPIKPCGK